jgi:ribonuclease R
MSAPARARGRRLDNPRVGVLVKKGRFLVAEPVFERGGQVTVDSRGLNGAGLGDLVLLGTGKRGAHVARRIGRPTVARDVIEGLMLERGLRRAYPRKAEADAREASGSPVATDARVDLRDLPTFTIDPEDARDFDDAISARREDDLLRLWVHIADVSAYVRPGGALEAEAHRRGTSVYVPGAVEPMLPEVLSADECSLRPGVDRLAVTVEMVMAGPEVRKVEFHRSLIRSDARLTYPQVDLVFDGRERAADPWAEPLALAREVAARLAEGRDSLEVGSGEPVFEFDEAGDVVGVHEEEQTESHGMIEQLMVLANEQVAGYLADRRLPTLYRVHEKPDPTAVAFMVEQLASLDVPTPPLPENMSPQQAAGVAAEASRRAAGHSRNTGRGRHAYGSLVLRSLKQAYYTPRNLGHAGLASARYCHFTSPIRRYPDLVAHRALLQGLGIDDVAAPAHELDETGTVASASEREAAKLERDADDVCLAFLLERALSEADPGAPPVFEGEVVGVIDKGAFVRFGEQGFEGMLPSRRMRGWWQVNGLNTALVSEDSGRELRLGESIEVIVDGVEPARGRVDLLPA